MIFIFGSLLNVPEGAKYSFTVNRYNEGSSLESIINFLVYPLEKWQQNH